METTRLPQLLCIALCGTLAFTTVRALEHEHEAKKVSAEETETIWKDLMEGNKRFVSGNMQKRDVAAARDELANGQHPKVIVLACADSRVAPELIFDKGLGELFVVRIAGNVADKDALGSIEYAVEHLHSSMIVILGHEKCGAVAAAASKGEIASPNLRSLVSKITPAIADLKTDATGNDLALLQVRANVNQSAVDMLKNSPVIRTALEESHVAVVKAVYHLKSGEVVKESAKEAGVPVQR